MYSHPNDHKFFRLYNLNLKKNLVISWYSLAIDRIWDQLNKASNKNIAQIFRISSLFGTIYGAQSRSNTVISWFLPFNSVDTLVKSVTIIQVLFFAHIKTDIAKYDIGNLM